MLMVFWGPNFSITLLNSEGTATISFPMNSGCIKKRPTIRVISSVITQYYFKFQMFEKVLNEWLVRSPLTSVNHISGFDNVSFKLNSLFSSFILQCFNFTINLIFIFLHLTNKYLQNEELEFSIDISFTM